jgi:hypothetical protein
MDPSADEALILGSAARVWLCVVRLHVKFKAVWAVSVLAYVEKLGLALIKSNFA